MRPIVPVRGLLLAALALATATVLSAAAAAAAPAGDADITVTQAHPLQGSTHFFVSLAGPDGEPVADSSMTATPIGPDGVERPAMAMEESSDGEFQGAVPMPEPGTWTVRFTTTDPAASTEATQVVEGASTPQAPTSAAVPATPVPAPTTEGTTPATTAEPDTTEVAAPTASDDSDDGLGMGLLVVGGLMVLAAVIGAGIALTRKPKPSDPDDDPVDPQA